ncbi:MAG TPA: sigma 54-interacting transcriptional regulator [Candidatus Margulisiibacteriota bacterium]|nr:sigma 54-interacting transcriptional regulator [Candidatus Margulisiibacteriota bacterium]
MATVDDILGASREIAGLREQIRRLAVFDAPGNPHVPTVLLQGETGTGKGLVARVIHDSGPRAGGPFIDVNCAAIPETMLEAELFGFEAGAFTDAKRAKPGLFEAASSGTLFLDEVDSLSAPVQSKVLKAIEEKRVRRLGAVTPRDVDVKLVAATQKDLKALVGSGGFRADLYHRLAVLILTIPPLRDRDDDVLLLAEHLLQLYGTAHGLAPKRLADSGPAWLRSYRWPGNVRELGHLMERATLLSPEDDIGGDDLQTLAGATVVAPAAAESARAADDVDDAAAEEEAARIRAALARTGGNVVRTAQLLGIGRNALRYRMRRLGITRPDAELPAAGVPAPRRAARATLAPQPIVTWEHKPVAVLAISLTFPAAAEATGFDPWTAATRWDAAIAARVEGFGGVFIERTPARQTALFGVPRALEQLPQRAVLAGLAIQRAAAQADAPRPDLRVAVHVGEVRIDATAATPMARLFPVGDTLSLPERLLGHAGRGEVLLSPQVGRRVARGFELRERALQLGPAQADRVHAHVVSRQRTRLPAADSHSEAGAACFVGRARELDLLCDTFARAAGGSGHVVFIAGDAGIGKSRLLAEFRQRIAGAPHRWIEGRCASYGSTTPFLPIIDSLRRYLGIDDRDDETSASAKIEREVRRLGADFAWTLPFVKQLLSLEVDETVRALDSASRRSELFRALRALTLRSAEIEPLVLVIEDLHWIDPASEEFLTFVADAVPAMRALLVLSHRSGYTHPFPDRSYHVRVALAPLSDNDMAAMTGAILGTPEIPAALHTLVAHKAEGNPFFVEELVKSLVEQGVLQCASGHAVLALPVGDIVVPDTVQDVLIARIDRLAEESRRAIQVASVIGREFALRLLARITEAGDQIGAQVEELRSLELIYEKALHPELAYMFKHALTHDVAYESVLLERRKHLHRTIGRAIEELYADRLAEHYETLAHHFSRGEDWQRALLYHERSAEKAAATHANRAVVEHCRQALEIVERLGVAAGDEVRARLHERIGQACFYLSEYAASGAAYEAAAACRDGDTRAVLIATAGFSHFWAHQYADARRCTDDALALARRDQLPAGEAMARVVHGFRCAVHDADFAGCEREQRAVLAICAQHGYERIEAFARFQLSLGAEWTGAYDAAVEQAARAIELGRKLRLPDIIIFAQWFLGKARCCTADYGSAIALLEEGYDLCDRIGDRAWKSRLLNTLGWCFSEIGSVERARDYNQQAALVARELGDPEILANANVNLAVNHLVLGDLAQALDYLEPVEAGLAHSDDPWMRWRYALHVRHARGEVELARGEPEKALGAADDELHGARGYHAPKIEARAQTLRAVALLALDRRDDAAAALGEALQIADRIGYRRGVWEAHRLLAEAMRRSGRDSAAATHAAHARAAAAQAAASLRDNELRRRLVASTLAAAPP